MPDGRTRCPLDWLTLRDIAVSAAAFRGHTMSRSFDMRVYNTGRIVADNACTVCGLGLYVDTMPPANGIDISGECVALGCPAS